MKETADIWQKIRYYFTELELFKIQDVGITVSHLVIAVLSVIIAFILSSFVRTTLKRRVFARLKLDRGLEYALLRFVHYIILVVGVYVGLKTINLPLGALVGLFAVLGVGIGFGLQNVTSNFISGVILLIERPVKVGDRITVGDVWGDVEKISLRTTRVKTPDNITIILPNSRLLENNVTNYSFGSPTIRLRVPVGVAYGSDVDLVIRTLCDAAREHKTVLDTPEPAVWFRGFGDSSLDFELLVWIPDASRKFWILSDLNRDIDRRFREAGVEIPFPQHDLHIRAGTHPVHIEHLSQQ